MSKKKLKYKAFDPSGCCPICSRPFKSDACPHSMPEAYERAEENKIRAIVRQEIEKAKELDSIDQFLGDTLDELFPG